ncbi:hypothetical protein CHS0354_002738 [Potamilus streckersoni]|uniref:CNNM transmembrane domain-containing protein n=1 Tax=Potamilus streckersoni TaxID=2493646 RepID=A0AAE0SJP2_9BIVA|nr:hypothetical protein CHS0354_002738 [Potamilus streckersoni]
MRLMSGLTTGLFALDITTLKVLKDGGASKERKYAAKILPLVQRHHALLVTLLLANAGAVEAMPICLDKISDPVTAILVSITAVLIFGEIIPQAVCTKYGLEIGAFLSVFVYIMMGLLFIIVWPVSKILDCILGKDHATFYRRAELKVLVDLHSDKVSQDGHCRHSELLTMDEVLIIKGALDMKSKIVRDSMIPLSVVNMLSIDDKMDAKTMDMLSEHSRSRIPVYEGSRDNIIGLILMKSLIKIDPNKAIPVREFQQRGLLREVLHVDETMPLFDLLNVFQTGKGHLAVVERFKVPTRSTQSTEEFIDLSDKKQSLILGEELEEDPVILTTEKEVVGIITLEDVIEELIQEEIVDETDVYVDIVKKIQVTRAITVNKGVHEHGTHPSATSYRSSSVGVHTTEHGTHPSATSYRSSSVGVHTTEHGTHPSATPYRSSSVGVDTTEHGTHLSATPYRSSSVGVDTTEHGTHLSATPYRSSSVGVDTTGTEFVVTSEDSDLLS